MLLHRLCFALIDQVWYASVDVVGGALLVLTIVCEAVLLLVVLCVEHVGALVPCIQSVSTSVILK